jgi:hypothetical protein
MLTVRNLPAVFEAIRNAGVPDRFTHSFLKQLGFTSSGDRAVISVMKSLRFLDESSTPTDRYKRFRDPSLSGAVMAEALRDAYSDLFTIKESAHSMPAGEMKGAFKRLSGKGDSVAEKMTATFRALAKLADWSPEAAAAAADSSGTDDGDPQDDQDEEPPPKKRRKKTPVEDEEDNEEEKPPPFIPTLRHDIHVHLPPTQDVKVYDAIFRSLREHFG